MKITGKWGSIVLSIWLILMGLTQFGLNFPNLGVVLAILAIVAGILILVGK